MLAPLQSLHLLLRRLCLQMLAPPQSLHLLLIRLCWQMLAPPQSLQVYLSRLCSHFLRPPESAAQCALPLTLPPPASRLLLLHRIVGLLPRRAVSPLQWELRVQMDDHVRFSGTKYEKGNKIIM
jgi:hypothetical protein